MQSTRVASTFCSAAAVEARDGCWIAPGVPFVSIIIVNYNGKRFLDDCLGAMARQTFPAQRREVIVVDNGSTDGSVEHLLKNYPWVRLVRAGKNLGFAAGNNKGFGHARGDLIALLNNDTVAEPQWLEALVEAALEHPRIGAATSKIVFKDEPRKINSVGLDLYRDGRAGDRGFRQADRGQFDQPTDVFGACGASVLLRREMLEDVGLFDERFFMYCEDVDLAWRARLRGWRFRYTPRSVVHHIHCGTSGEWSPLHLYHAERNCLLVNLKNAPLRQVVRAFVGCCGRGLWQWLRVLTLCERGWLAWRRAFAYVRCFSSLLVHTPAMLRKRFEIRCRRRLVPDRALVHFLTRRS